MEEGKVALEALVWAGVEDEYCSGVMDCEIVGE